MGKCSKSGLGIELSRLKSFENPKVRVEQYATDPEIAAEVLWNGGLMGDMQKVSVDLGCGTGVLGLGAMLLGCQKVYFVESEAKSLKIARENYEDLKSEGKVSGKAVFLCQDIKDFNSEAEVVLENPPFGTKVKHADKEFLEKAMQIGKIIYSFHKTSTRKFVEAIAKDNGFRVTHEWKFRFPLKQTMEFHRKKIHRIEVSCFRLQKIDEK